MADKGAYNLLIDLRANVANLSKDMESANSILKASTGKINTVMRGFFEGLGREIASGLTRQILNLNQTLGSLADKGEIAGSIAENFEKLGGSSRSIEAARKAVLGTVSAFDLMKAANEGFIKGIPNLNKNFASIAEYAGRFADATGGDTVETLNRLTQAIGSGANKALLEFGIQVDSGATRSEKMAQAIAQLESNMGNLAPLTDSVANAHMAFSTAMGDAINQIGIGINSSTELANIYRDLEAAIKSIDWKKVGDDVASMISSVASVLPSLQTVTTEIGNIAKGLRALTGNLTPIESGIQKLGAYKAELGKLEEAKGSFFTGLMYGENFFDPDIAKKKKQIADLEKSLQNMQNQDSFDAFIDGLPGTPITSQKPTRETSPTFGGGSSSIARKESQSQKKLLEDRQKSMADMVDEDFRARSRVEELLAKKREDSVQSWANQFQGVFSGSILGLSSDFSNVAASFTQDLVEGISGLFSGSSSSGGSGGGGLGVFGNFLGSGLSADEAHRAGVSGPGMEDGSFGPSAGVALPSIGVIMQAAQSLMQFTQDIRNARKTDAQNNDFSGTGSVLAQLILGNQLGGPLGSMIGGMFGRGPQNKETQGRHTFANYMEDQAKAKGGFTVFDGRGGQSQLTNFLEGSSTRFNDGKWADKINSQADTVKTTFLGLGEAFKEMLGITEDVGGQIGFLLGENLGYSLDSARHMVKRLGFSLEEIVEKFVDIGLKGEKTWLEIETSIQGVTEAFKPGLTAVGAFGTAMQNLIGSGAKGFEAVQSIRDIAVEAAEAGIKNFDQLRGELLKTFDPATVDAFFAALKQRGVTTIGEMMNLSDRAAGGIVADMQALGVKFTDSGKKIGDSLSQNTSSTDANTQALNSNTRALGGKAAEPVADDEEIVEDGTAVARRAMRGPTIAVNGSITTPRSNRTSRRGDAMFSNISSVGGGGGGYIVNIDARGAGHGVEKTIRSAMNNSEKRVMESMGRTLQRRNRRTT